MVRFFGEEEENNQNVEIMQTIIPQTQEVQETLEEVQTPQVEQMTNQPINNQLDNVPTQMVEQLGTPIGQDQVPDPLNNARNPIPVNPISNKEEIFDYDSVDFKPKDLLNIVFKSLTKPASTMEEASKYRSLNNSIKVTVILSLCTIILKVLISIITGMFFKSYNVATSSYVTKIDFTQMFNQEWLNIISTSFIVSAVAILLVTTTYYLVSFIKNKSIPYGRYLIITSVSFIPFLVGYTIIYPVLNIISSYLAVLLLIVSIVFSMINLLNGINDCLVFNSNDEKVRYNSVVISIIFLIIFTLLYMLFPETLNITNIIAGK